MRSVVLDGEHLELTGRRVSGMKNWRAVRRLARAGYLRAVWTRGLLHGMEYQLTDTGQAAAQTEHVP
jgi:hypothetical protein